MSCGKIIRDPKLKAKIVIIIKYISVTISNQKSKTHVPQLFNHPLLFLISSATKKHTINLPCGYRPSLSLSATPNPYAATQHTFICHISRSPLRIRIDSHTDHALILKILPIIEVGFAFHPLRWKMAASCCYAALFALPRAHPRCGVVASNSVSRSQKNHGSGLSFRVQRRLEARESVRASSLRHNKSKYTQNSYFTWKFVYLRLNFVLGCGIWLTEFICDSWSDYYFVIYWKIIWVLQCIMMLFSCFSFSGDYFSSPERIEGLFVCCNVDQSGAFSNFNALCSFLWCLHLYFYVVAAIFIRI